MMMKRKNFLDFFEKCKKFKDNQTTKSKQFYLAELVTQVSSKSNESNNKPKMNTDEMKNRNNSSNSVDKPLPNRTMDDTKKLKDHTEVNNIQKEPIKASNTFFRTKFNEEN